jgi:putative phage-type endonuclease
VNIYNTHATEVCSSRDRDAWLAARRTGIGASEAAALIGEHAWLSLARLVGEKRGLFTDDAAVERFEWGLRHEPTILAAYSSTRYAGRETKPHGTLLRSLAHPWAIATLDGVTLHPVHGWIPWEAKSTEVYRGDEWQNGAPPTYWWQCQHQMLVTGAPCVSIAALLGVHRLVWDDVERDEAAIRRLILRGPEVWAMVESGEDPPGPYDRETFAAFWPSEDGSVIELDEDIASLDQERETLVVRLKADGDRKSEIDDAIRERLRAAERGVLPGGRVSYSLKAQTRKECVIKASTTRVLRRHEAKEGRARS